MSEPLRIGVAGLGTVGIGVLKIFSSHAAILEARAGRPIVIKAVSALNRDYERGVDLSAFAWFENASDMAFSKDVDVIVEVIGGSEGVARTLTELAIENFKHVVTANKAMLALHGTSLARAAEASGVSLAYEAAVAGGIPIVKALREGLAANQVDRLYGILNGTCNYILSSMEETGRVFADVMAEAKRLGYAESDPSLDLDGTDTAHKLAILASVAFGTEVDFTDIHIEGIRHISPIDIEFAGELGYGIKLLGIATRMENGILKRVHPCMVPINAPINHVRGVFNGIEVAGEFIDKTIYEGRGAGAGPTASAIVADIVDLARGNSVPVFGVPANALKPMKTFDMGQYFGPYYIRLTVVDRPGVFADIAAILRDSQVSMETVVQRGRAPGEPVSLVMTLHESREADVALALDAISALKTIVEPPCMIRIENFS